MSDLKDTGDLLEVSKEERLSEDDPAHEDPNTDEFADLSSVPDGEVIYLSTAKRD